MATFNTTGPRVAAPSQVPWYVFQVLSGTRGSPDLPIYVAVQTGSPKGWIRNRPGANISAGPFWSKVTAQNWIDKKVGLAPGTDPTPQQQIHNAGGPHIHLPHIPNPFSWLSQQFGGMLASAIEAGVIQIIKDLWNVVAGPVMVIGGIILAVLVLGIYFKNDIAAAAPLIAGAVA